MSKTKEKIGYVFVAILLILAISLCFWISIYLGLFVLLFSIGVIWWIYGVKKKRVDEAMNKVAHRLGLKFYRDPFKYGIIKGEYRGYNVEIGVYTDFNAFGGAGVILTSLSGKGAFSALDIHNFTGIKIKLDSEFKESKVISDKFPLILMEGNEIKLIFPYVSSDPREIETNLLYLVNLVEKNHF